MMDPVEPQWDEEVVFDRELAALVAVACSLVAAVTALTPFALAGIVPALAGMSLGGWAAARGERPVMASVAVFLGLAAATAAVALTVT